MYGILSDALDVQESVKNNEAELEDIKKSMDVILEYIAEVRQCLRQLEKQKKLKEERSEEEMKRVPDTNTALVELEKRGNDVRLVVVLAAHLKFKYYYHFCICCHMYTYTFQYHIWKTDKTKLN